ncbi:hypothetical protein PHYBOEH_004229 [Phytophthora boehmeriae]|uniref:Uncharacterized protein n=1 Tax=Phytophthora boehmeriae TaxID=109152 RepID=A0A8T1WNZ9_9STRA|nr:hypothetical protein PHYBOEH_004229 [Phytophthora boehmeriae]
MGGKRRKNQQELDNPETWDIIANSQELEEFYSSDFDLVSNTQVPDAVEVSLETVAETQDSVVDHVSDAQLPPPSREPAHMPTYRLKKTTKDTHSSVICKLTSILRLPKLTEEIKRICVVMKQIQLEGWHLANLHVLRCLNEKEEPPKIEQMFFYRCCTASLANHGSYETKYPSFYKTCSRYWAERAQVPTYEAERVVNGSSMINELARLMSINALNMIALHFRRRLHQYVRFRYAPEGKVELKYRETKRIVDSCYRVKSAPEMDDEGNPTGKMVKVWTTWDDTTDPVELELRRWLEIVPWQWLIRENSAHFIQKLHDMLVFMEKFVEKHPKTKGARVYSLLPVATSYQTAYMKINASTLHGLLSRVVADPSVKIFLEKELNGKDGQLSFDLKTFQNNKTDVMRAVFDVQQFETENRKFVDEVKTNGYAASVTMQRPRPGKKKVKTPEELAERDDFAKELFKLGPEYSPDVLIGIDPGMRSLVTAATVGRLRRRHRARKRTSTRRQRRQRHQRKERITEISTREYRHLARMNDFRRYNERLKQREPWYAGVVHGMPSFKTANYNSYVKRLEFFWTHLRFLLAFSAEQAFLKWRFTQDRAKMKAIDVLAAQLVPKPSKQVCIAFGDWSRRDGIKGHATGPVKGFIEALKKRATVVPMDEYQTSITCSCCHQRLKQARLFSKMKRKEDEEDIRLKSRPSKKEEKEIEEMRKFRNPKLADFKIVLKGTRNVLRCVNSRCRANFWNRDVNAARNMLELLRSGLKGKSGVSRLRVFRRRQ